MFRLSESRGKEASGLAVHNQGTLRVYKAPTSATKMLQSMQFDHFFSEIVTSATGRLSLIGHTRLVTDGQHFIDENNQPVVNDGFAIVHNGIITNHAELWRSNQDLVRNSQVDTEIILRLFIKNLNSCSSPADAMRHVFKKIVGTASIALCANVFDGILLATNNGSLYYVYNNRSKAFVFASERLILSRFLLKCKLFKDLGVNEIKHLKANSALYIDTNQQHVADLSNSTPPVSIALKKTASKLIDFGDEVKAAEQNMRRCTRCVLPETMPFIKFDEDGICNYCHSYKKMAVSGDDELLRIADTIRGKGDTPDCIAMFSGGRDSCYGLHFITKELGLNPLAYTYDWGMITDIGRRNQSRMCGQLGVEHILISADINKKRYFIRKNIEAWLKRPRLGMVPIFMAGDKQYFYYIDQLKRSYNISTVFVFENPLEATRFKTGFCGIDESGNSSYDIRFSQKLKLFGYYSLQYLLNLRYFNLSLSDSAFALWSYYFASHNFIYLFRHIPWNENKINRTLIDGYDWETDKGTSTTWRIGDGTAAFYNYIYKTVAGFTENDTLRSNQIREGDLTRDQALSLIEKENRPRWDSLEWYAKTIGFNLSEALTVINTLPKLYYPGKQLL
jgi:hypothetical protein